MTQIPKGTKYLVITLSNEDGRFSGISRLSRLLGKKPSFFHLVWENRTLDLRKRLALKWVLVNGHGPQDAARISSGNLALDAGQLVLPRRAHLYLPACYQGKETIIQTWAAESGVTASQVHGAAGETEAALTTLLLAHLHKQGPELVAHWFEQWRRANDFYRPVFPLIRQTYQETGFLFGPALEALKGRIDLVAFKDFVKPATEAEYQGYLNYLI